MLFSGDFNCDVFLGEPSYQLRAPHSKGVIHSGCEFALDGHVVLTAFFVRVKAARFLRSVVNRGQGAYQPDCCAVHLSLPTDHDILL